MDTVLNSFLVEIPRAAAIWSALLAVAAIAVAALLAGTRRERTERAERVAPEPHRPPTDELSRYSDEVAVAADRAAATAQRHRTQWLAAQAEVEAAWQAYEKADAATRRVFAGAALPTPRTPRTPAEYADRERYLHRAATAAFWRKELSVLELSDILAHRNGWDPRRHPVEQEVLLHRAVRDSLFAAHRVAAVKERAAWQVAEAAAVAAASLRAEACTAAKQAGAAQLGWMPTVEQPVVMAQPRIVATVPLRSAIRLGAISAG